MEARLPTVLLLLAMQLWMLWHALLEIAHDTRSGAWTLPTRVQLLQLPWLAMRKCNSMLTLVHLVYGSLFLLVVLRSARPQNQSFFDALLACTPMDGALIKYGAPFVLLTVAGGALLAGGYLTLVRRPSAGDLRWEDVHVVLGSYACCSVACAFAIARLAL